MSERNYYMVRAMESRDEDFEVFFNNNVVAVGWSKVNFKDYDSEDTLREAVYNKCYAKSDKGNSFIGKKINEVLRFADIKEATLKLGGMDVNIAVTSGMKNAQVLLDDIRAGKSKYHFIEVMCCPGGCINGGGMPVVRHAFLPDEDLDIIENYREKRASALYSEDERQVLRQSHNNPQIKELYEKFLGEPNSHLAHELLHTSYNGREPFRAGKEE